NVKKVPISTVQEWEQFFQSKPEWREGLTKIPPSKVLEFEEYFQTVATFRMHEQLIWNISWEGVEDTVLEGERAERLQERIKTLVMVHYRKHPSEEWIQFIRKLLELHIVYKEREMVKLSKELKRILICAVTIKLKATEWKYDRLYSEVDRFELGQIFPDEIKLIKEKLKPMVQCEVTKMNTLLPSKAQLDPAKISNLIDELLSKGYMSILTHIRELNLLWFSEEELYREDKLWSHLISLTVSIESLGGEWFPGTAGLGSVFEKAFRGYKTLTRGRICDARDPSEFIKKLNLILQKQISHTDPWGSRLLIANLVRNYVAHGGRYTSEMLGNKFIIVYEAILATLLCLFYTKP
ncbi:MAG: hypothetical protein QMD05_11045, partial [Candidatus Brocadiaceae bacterium]|nr:hypothetical protein [Candidatus Brocadiaceae bacterium]